MINKDKNITLHEEYNYITKKTTEVKELEVKTSAYIVKELQAFNNIPISMLNNKIDIVNQYKVLSDNFNEEEKNKWNKLLKENIYQNGAKVVYKKHEQKLKKLKNNLLITTDKEKISSYFKERIKKQKENYFKMAEIENILLNGVEMHKIDYAKELKKEYITLLKKIITKRYLQLRRDIYKYKKKIQDNSINKEKRDFLAKKIEINSLQMQEIIIQQTQLPVFNFLNEKSLNEYLERENFSELMQILRANTPACFRKKYGFLAI